MAKEWDNRGGSWKYVWNQAQFDAVNPANTDHLLGLFERSHMEYEHDRPNDTAGEPSLAELTKKAIDILSKNDRGFILHVEAARIDHAHHEANAHRALTDTIAMDEAVKIALANTDPRETLIIVTADHGHVFTFGGYPTRGNPILGLVIENIGNGDPDQDYLPDSNGQPFTTLGYWNGPGYVNGSRPTYLSHSETQDPDYVYETAIPLGSDTPLRRGCPGLRHRPQLLSGSRRL